MCGRAARLGEKFNGKLPPRAMADLTDGGDVGGCDTNPAPPAPAAPKMSKNELRQEVQAAEMAARQLLSVVESWPAFVTACVAPLRAEKGVDASAAVMLRCPTRVVSTLAVVCHNSKATSTAERFKPLLPRLTLVSRDELGATIAGGSGGSEGPGIGWANADELADELGKAPASSEEGALLVVAVEIGAGADGGADGGGGPVAIHGYMSHLRAGKEGEESERGPWRYCLDSGATFVLSAPRCAARLRPPPRAGRTAPQG